MPRRRRDAGRPVTGAEVDASLSRRIRIWAQTWRRCPKKGCRRASRCLRFDDCAGVPKGHYWPSERDKRRYWEPLRAALRESRGGTAKPGHDARERERPLPPAPGHGREGGS